MVPRSVPKFIAGKFAHLNPGNESGRRELAQWLTDPENPLLARVYVNRLWQHLLEPELSQHPMISAHVAFLQHIRSCLIIWQIDLYKKVGLPKN